MGLFDFLGFGGQPSPPDGGGGAAASSGGAPATNQPLPVAPPTGGLLGGDPNAVDPQTGFRTSDLQTVHAQQLQNFGLMLMAASSRMSSAQRAQMLGQAAGAFGDTTHQINQMVGARYNQHLMQTAQQKQAAEDALRKKYLGTGIGDEDNQFSSPFTKDYAQIDPTGVAKMLATQAETEDPVSLKVRALTKLGVPQDQAIRLAVGGSSQIVGDAINGYAKYDPMTNQLVPLGALGAGGGLGARMTQGLTPPPGVDGGTPAPVPAMTPPGPAMTPPPVQAGAVPAPGIAPRPRTLQDLARPLPGQANGSAPSNIMPGGVPANLAPAYGPGASIAYNVTNPISSAFGSNPTREDLDRQSSIGFAKQLNNEVMSALATDITGTKTNAARELARDPLPEPASLGTNAAMALHRYEGVSQLVQQQMADTWNTLQRATSVGDKSTAQQAATKYQDLQRANDHLTTSLAVLRQNLNGKTGLPNPAADAAAAGARQSAPGQPGANPLAASARQYLGN